MRCNSSGVFAVTFPSKYVIPPWKTSSVNGLTDKEIRKSLETGCFWGKVGADITAARMAPTTNFVACRMHRIIVDSKRTARAHGALLWEAIRLRYTEPTSRTLRLKTVKV